MKNFCQECGHSLNNEDVVCINCGTKIAQTQKISKIPMTKKQKAYFSIVGALIIILIGFSAWANSYYSKEATSKRFTEAIGQKDAKALANLVVHEDGSKIIPMEAEALVKLVDREGKRSIEDYFSIQPHGKLLGIFQKHKVEMIDQYAYFEGPVEPLSFQFNKETVKEEDRGDYFVLFGPLSPGIYEVETKFENEFAIGSTTSEAYLRSYEGDHSWITVDLPISEVMFEIENYSASAMKKISVIVNETEIPVDTDGITDSVGPLLLDGSQTAKIVVEYPWGEVASEDMVIESEHQYITAAVFSENQQTELANLLLQFGEEWAQAQATNTSEAMTTTTDSFKVELQQYSLDSYKDRNIYYSGQLEQIAMDANLGGLLEDQLAVLLMAEFTYKESKYALMEDPKLEDDTYSSRYELMYDEQQKKWFINSTSSWNYELNATHVLKGSGVVYSPNSESLKTAKEDVMKEELQRFMEKFVYSSVVAINNQSISYVEDLMTTDGPRLKESADYIAHLADKGITEEQISTEVEKVEEKDSNLWEVTSTDEYKIFYPDKELQKKYKTVSLVKKVDGNWLVHELISTEEI